MKAVGSEIVVGMAVWISRLDIVAAVLAGCEALHVDRVNGEHRKPASTSYCGGL